MRIQITARVENQQKKAKIRKRRRRVAIAKKAKRKEMWKQLRPTEEVEPENKARAKIKNTKNPR